MADDLDNIPHNRRQMFRFSLKRIVEPLAEYIEDRLSEVDWPVERAVLRPPGALPEKQFLQTCYRCGNCVDVCPATAIRPITSDDVSAAGTPYIDPDLAACVVCDELACMKACPSGALRLVASAERIDMGLARVDHEVCLRGRNEDCTICIDKCPFGSTAIGLSDHGEVEVRPGGCVGCGVCQFYCPTVPKAIVVDPT